VIVVIGVGNEYRRDDRAGLAVAERLLRAAPSGVSVLTCPQEPSRLIDALEGADAAFVVDACSSGADPGTLQRFDAAEGEIPARAFRSSTHAFGVGEAIELARALGKLPRQTVVYGIEGEDFSAGEGLSPRVSAAVDLTAAELLRELDRLSKEAPCTSAR
jgi:hydrogenase maturation protease